MASAWPPPTRSAAKVTERMRHVGAPSQEWSTLRLTNAPLPAGITTDLPGTRSRMEPSLTTMASSSSCQCHGTSQPGFWLKSSS